MSAENQYDISVIVPVYNAERFLQECIDSLLHQTKDDIEIVLVNDGSTDNSKKIIEENCKRHDNITFVDQENKGVCVARNAGIAAAKGDYIGWLDADDFLKPTALEELYDLIMQNNADYGYYNVCFYPEAVKTKKAWFKEYKGKRDWNFIERNSQCTNTLTKKSLLKKINIAYWFSNFYEYGWIPVLLFAENIVSLDKELYVYRVGHESASGGSYIGKVPKFRRHVELTRRLPEMIQGTKYERELKTYFEYRYIYTLILLMIVAGVNNDKKAYSDARSELFRVDYLKNENTKMILDNNHGKLKSFVLRRILPLNFFVAEVITKAVL